MWVNFDARANGCLTVSPSGRLDHSSAEPFSAALMPHVHDANTKGIVIDLSNVEYVSSVGLRVLMIFVKDARRNQKEVVVAGLQPIVAEIFAISRFDRIFQCFESREAAEAAIDASLRK